MIRASVCTSLLAAPLLTSPGKHCQPYRPNPVAGAAAALQPDANDAATAIESAINRALEEGIRTGDLARGAAAVSTDEMGDIIARYVAEGCNHGQNVIRKIV